MIPVADTSHGVVAVVVAAGSTYPGCYAVPGAQPADGHDAAIVLVVTDWTHDKRALSARPIPSAAIDVAAQSEIRAAVEALHPGVAWRPARMEVHPGYGVAGYVGRQPVAMLTPFRPSGRPS